MTATISLGRVAGVRIELAHAIVARRNGLRAEDITPVAVRWGGPVVRRGPHPDLAGIDLVLAVFTVIPAAPLDGGRLLWAAIWWRTGNQLKATLWAGRAGQVFGWVLIGVGLSIVFTGGLGGLWTALIGWFLVGAATAETQQATARDQLGGLPVRQVTTPHPDTVPVTTTVAQLLDSDAVRRRHSTFPLTDDRGSPAGLVTFTRIRGLDPDRRSGTTLGEIGCPTSELTLVGPDDPAAELLARLSECAEGRALVVEDGQLVGIVSSSDLNRVLGWSGLLAGPTTAGGDRAR